MLVRDFWGTDVFYFYLLKIFPFMISDFCISKKPSLVKDYIIPTMLYPRIFKILKINFIHWNLCGFTAWSRNLTLYYYLEINSQFSQHHLLTDSSFSSLIYNHSLIIYKFLCLYSSLFVDFLLSFCDFCSYARMTLKKISCLQYSKNLVGQAPVITLLF